MGRIEDHINAVAGVQRQLITRSEVIELGGHDRLIEHRLKQGRWIRVHAGVYQIDRRPLDWKSELLAAVFACGPSALVSHRSAFVLWGLDGISTNVLEVTVDYGALPIPKGVIAHRSRRGREHAEIDGIPVTTAERTLLDCASMLPRIVLAKALDSAIRRKLTSLQDVFDLLVEKGGRGVKGTKALRWVVRERLHDTATGSGSEFELLFHMQMAFLPRPELQHPLFTENGRRVPDFYWPELGKAVEVDGIDAHSSADKLESDLRRQNDLMNMGIELRRFSARDVRRDPNGVVAQIGHFLEA